MTVTTTPYSYTGVNASMALPMNGYAEPDRPALRRYARWLVDQGVEGLTVNADTGEGAHLTLAERVQVVETVKEEVGDNIQVVSGLVAAYTGQGALIARTLREAGADALLVFGIPAFAGEPLPPELVYSYYASIGDEGLPLIGFSLTPTLGGVVLRPDVLSRIADVSELAAFKDASFNPLDYLATRDALRSADADVALLSGCDNFMYESFVLGADGALLGYAGLAAGLTVNVLTTVQSGDLGAAERLNRERMQPLAEVLFGAPVRDSRVRIKEGLKMLGVIDDVTVRAPLLPLGGNERANLSRAMKTARLL